MVTSDDDMITDIIVEGDQEEISRMSKVRLFACLFVLFVWRVGWLVGWLVG
jgi:hypothetical protein